MNDRVKLLLDQANAEFDEAVAADKEAAAQKALGGDSQPKQEKSGGFVQWVKNLPENISIGVIDSAIQMWDALEDFGEAAEQGERLREAADGATPTPELTPGDRRNLYRAEDTELRKTVLGVRNVIAEKTNNGAGDQLTRGVAQFMVPFLGFSKVFGVARAATTTGKVAAAAGAEAATMATAFDPHEGRLADLIELGRQSEGKLADTLNALAPDGSAFNAYLEYMTSREDESDAEGRFKNVVDGLAGSAAVAGFLKVGAKTLKGARMALEAPGNIAVKLPEIGAPEHLQGHALELYHGTPHDFEAFDISKIGSGEGAQVFGHGIYLAENEAVAKSYRSSVSYRDAVRQFVNELPDDADFDEVLDLANTGGFSDKASHVIKELAKADWLGFDYPAQAISAAFKALDGFDVPPSLLKAVNEYGNLYSVHVPDSEVAKMLKWDEPWEQQAPEVQEAVRKLGPLTTRYGQEVPLERTTGEDIYKLLSEHYGAEGASEQLKKAGVPGIRYFDKGSRRSANGTRNMVLFDDKLATITKKNGAPVVHKDAQTLAAKTLEQFQNDPLSALVHLTEQADNMLDDDARARFVAAAHIVRKQIPNEGINIVESPEGHTVVVGKQPLLTFLTPEEAQAAVADVRKLFGHAFEKRAAAEHAAASDKNFATLHSFSRVLQANVDRPVSTHSLLSALEKHIKGDTEQGAFYKELLGRLVRKRIGGTTTVMNKGGRSKDSAGFWRQKDNGLELYPAAFGGPKTLLHTFAHEAVHAATVHEMRMSPRVYSQMARLTTQAAEAFTGADKKTGDLLEDLTRQSAALDAHKQHYGFTNPEEFVAEIESNPKFRKLMQETKLPDGGTAWEKYLETIAGILGITALIKTPDGMKEFSKLMMGDTKQEKQRA